VTDKHDFNLLKSVLSLAAVGKGCPDLVIGKHGVNLLIEIKDGSNCPSKRVLTPDQIKFHAQWNGKIHIVKSVDDAVLLKD